ncbi:hypothetical protein ACJX0J_011746 [Zea mays]
MKHKHKGESVSETLVMLWFAYVSATFRILHLMVTAVTIMLILGIESLKQIQFQTGPNSFLGISNNMIKKSGYGKVKGSDETWKEISLSRTTREFLNFVRGELNTEQIEAEWSYPGMHMTGTTTPVT